MQVYLVGGAVRDQLLNHPVYDKDWVVVGATVDEMLEQGFQPVGKDFPVFIHPKTGEEYALARTERKSGKGYTGFQYFASPDVSLEEDLIRRDLTINAMAQANNGEIIDPYHGQQDLNDRILRHVSPAFSEDPLRVLRVARFYARYAHLGFSVADETVELMTLLSTSDELIHLTAERVWKETERALAEETPFAYIDLLDRCQALPVLFHEWQCLIENEQKVRKVLKRLQRNKQFGQNVFSCLMTIATTQLPDDQAHSLIASMCERLRTPKAWLLQAQHVRQWHRDIADVERLSGEKRFNIIQSLDLLRRPQRLDGVFDCCAALNELDSMLKVRFKQLLSALNKLQASELIAEGFKGKALGDELNRRRGQICDQI